MKDANKTRNQLIDELVQMRQRVAELEASETERKRAGEALWESEEKLRTMFQAIEDAILVTDLGSNVLDVNQALLRLVGYDKKEDIIGRNAFELVSPKDRTASKQATTKTFEEERPQERRWYRLLTADGREVDTEASAALLYDISGNPTGIINMVRDITERKRAEEAIRHLAYHDTLTDLPNRLLFNEILTLELARAQRKQQQVAVMLLDLDEFKNVNDTLGHTVGDQLLRAVANRLKRSVRKADTVGRMGGDEFMLILPELSQAEDAAKVAQKLVEAFTKPFVLRAHKPHITGSIGIAIYPNDGEEAETLMKNADISMYRAKEQGRNNYQYYTKSMKSRVLIDF